MSEFKKFYFEKDVHHKTTGIDYRVTVGDYPFYDEKGEVIASIYSYCYVALPEKKEKPVIFCYNGGPGASSSWVHLGLMSPKTVTFPNYPQDPTDNTCLFDENPNCILDSCDIVCINPPGTSLTYITDEGKKRYYRILGDGNAVAEFIVSWLKSHGRENSPVYLLGESYGTLRNLAVAKFLPESVKLKGIVSIGTSFGVGSKNSSRVEPNVRRFGANAACCWFHFHRDECKLEEFVNKAMEFAYGDYAHALLMGYRLPEDEFERTLEQASYYTGLAKDILRAGRLRFDEQTYLQKMMPGKLISAYDARVTKPLDHEMTEEEWIQSLQTEPFFLFADTAIQSCMDKYQTVDIEKPDDRYSSTDFISIAMNWDYQPDEFDSLTAPVGLMKERNDLRILFAAGYYDLQSTFDFVTYYLSRYEMPMDRIVFHVYDSGHACYIGGDTLAQLSGDIRKFVEG